MPRTTSLARRTAVALLAAASFATVAGIAPASAATVSESPRNGLAAVDGQRSSAALERNKRIAVEVLTQLFEKGNVKVADKYVRADFLQHSPTVPDGREALENLAADLHTRYPGFTYNVKRVLAQGDLVLVHSNPIEEPGTRGDDVMDIFRFDEKGRIAEHWDTRESVPATTVNGNDMFGTVSNPNTNQPSGPCSLTPLSQKLVLDYFNTLLVQKNPDAIGYLNPAYYQHNPSVPSGTVGMREGFVEFFKQFPNVTTDLKRTIADKDYVAVHFRYRLHPEDSGQAIMGIFRVQRQEDGQLKIIEHWDVIENVPATSANNNTMF
ncbi:nuclear transport factor 2 family protein [Streptomyces sp. NRRL S-350]|uniref:nuclear transport factor 2 family protein n=1 Tax=Streptomyces sp. NRRL S-350 TaxID=1463902 RepID=UPI0004BF8870|nr:nuclear transport factor 2 family protein [Streptomyces sp. NRRL S-350]